MGRVGLLWILRTHWHTLPGKGGGAFAAHNLPPAIALGMTSIRAASQMRARHQDHLRMSELSRQGLTFSSTPSLGRRESDPIDGGES
jgi:hypothetical protein